MTQEMRNLLYPRALAVFGSAAPGKIANILIHRAIEGGMGKIYAVNPKGLGVENVAGFRSLAEIGAPVDLAVIAAPAEAVSGILEDCGIAGVKSAVIISSGFSEVGNLETEKEIKAVAQKHGIRFVGPNCAGIVNTHSGLIATIESTPVKGSMAVVSQSGAIGGAFMAMSAEQKLGISKFLSFGNGADLTIIDFLNYLKDDDETSVIAMYLESVENGRLFMETLCKVTKKKPVVVVKSGRTSTGQRAAKSHTGSMAGSDVIFDAAIRQCGVIRADSLAEMFDICRGFSTLPPMKDRKLLIVTNSGGPGVMATDIAETATLFANETSEALRGRLSAFFKPFAGLKNPIDLTVEGTGEEYEKAIACGLDEYDAAVALYIGTPYLKALPVAKGVVNAAKQCGKPVTAVFMVGSDIEETHQYLRENGIPEYDSGENAVKTLAKMADYEAIRSSYLVKESGARPEFGFDGPLLEPDCMKLLSESGVPVPPYRFVSKEEEVAKACAEIGYPVVMKVVSPQIIHKSDVGGVRLNLCDEAEAAEAFHHMQQIARGRDFRGVMIYPMLKSGCEVILGLTIDAQFGPVVAVGMGGIYTEVIKDIAFRIAPIDKEQARQTIEGLRSAAIFRGIRGQRPCDVEALADMTAKFSQLPFLYPDIVEADINPAYLYEAGVIAADVRIMKA